MVLVSLLIALLLERALPLSKHWQLQFVLLRLISTAKRSQSIEPLLSGMLGFLLLLLLPLAVVALWLSLVEGRLFGVLSLLSWVVIILACLGCPNFRSAYHTYLRASCRGDESACEAAKQILTTDACPYGSGDQGLCSLGNRLAWINFRFYACVMLWTALAGPYGAVLYATARGLSGKTDLPASLQQRAGQLLHWLEWLPVRITALGYALVGDFQRGFAVWLANLLNWRLPTGQFFAQVVSEAADREQMTHSCFIEACHMVTLAKRTVILLVSGLALLTIYGTIL